MKADLHIHSNNSDGSDTTQELAEKIIKARINIFALTDHDTIDGCEEIKNYLNVYHNEKMSTVVIFESFQKIYPVFSQNL